jgi:glycogen debranching enzyme
MTQHLQHHKPGVSFGPGGVRFTVVSQHATGMTLCLFDKGGNRETARHEMSRAPGSVFTLELKNIKPGQHYGYRVEGPWEPEQGHRFDPTKVLVDPYATLIDRPYAYHPHLTKRGIDTHKLAPKAILEQFSRPAGREITPLKEGGLIYELNVKGFTQIHPDIPEDLRGTLAALAHPAAIAHFKKLNVAAVELMPITAWIDERHLYPLGLSNAWGYNAVSFMALDPRLTPGGISDLRHVADALHKEGIALFLDIVFNHTGESDLMGPVLSMRGLDNALYYRHHTDEPGALVNDVGTGNTLAVERGPVRELVIDALRHFVIHGGVDGFRFDLGVALGRTSRGFSPHAPLFEAMRHDHLIAPATLIAEPWDMGPGGYQLGNFPPQFLEWNDRYRDDMRRFWRGDPATLGVMATRLSGSSDVFHHQGETTRSVNFLAAHDGFTLADLTSYKRKHNFDNGEDNRDGHGENFSWNHGVEGSTTAPGIRARRKDDIKAMLALLFLSRGNPMLTAGDEFGRSQNGNNNAYAQDNEVTWLDWDRRDQDLEAFATQLSSLRAAHPALMSSKLLSGKPHPKEGLADIVWLRPNGEEMAMVDWEKPDNHFLALILSTPFTKKKGVDRVAIAINRNEGTVALHLPTAGRGMVWQSELATRPARSHGGSFEIAAHSVAVFVAAKGRHR